MSPDNGSCSSESDNEGLTFEATQLTLGLPGDSRGITDGGARSGTKRGFLDTVVDLNLGTTGCKSANISPPPKTQVVGWPPVRAYRKNAMKKNSKYVKVAVDGAPYLRKVDLEMYSSYQQLLNALEDMFSWLTIRNHLSEKKIIDEVNGVEYVPTYKDKDGDWMLVGDVPWKMFVESCNRLRLMNSKEATGLAPRTPPRCTSTTQAKRKDLY